MVNESDSFIRWQSVTRDHLGATTNLVFGLATGLLAFQVSLLLDSKLSVSCARGFGMVSLVALALSVVLAIRCSLNRLTDFRLTAQTARRREKGDSNVAELREDTDVLGKSTWALFRLQLWTFGVGAAAVAVAVTIQLLT